MARQIKIDIIGDADSYDRATRQAAGASDRMDKGLRNSAIGGAVAGVAMAGVTKAIDFVTDGLSAASEAAKEDTASSDRLALALDNTGRAQKLNIEQIEAAISANQAKGVSDSEQRQGIADFLDKTGSATEAMKLNTATVELAAAKGITYAQAEKMMISAAAGKTAALEKAGVALQKGASITDVARAVTDKFSGSLDRQAATQGGKAKINSEKMGEAMEKVGRVVNKVAEVVMPAVAEAMTWVIDNVIPPLGRAFEVIAPIVSRVFGLMARYVQGFVHVFSNVVSTIVNIAGRIIDVFQTVRDIIGRVFSTVGGVIRGAINAVIDTVNHVIGAINGVSFTSPDWLPGDPVTFSANIGYLPRLHAGGMVPGIPGSDVPAMLQAGERVIPRGGAGGGNAYYITVQALDPRDVGALVVGAIDAYEQANGRRYARAT